MTSTDRPAGAAHPAGVVLTKEKRSKNPVFSLGVRLAFVVWLFVVTDGAAFSPFSFVGDAFGGWVWHPLLAVFGLGQVVMSVVRRHRSPDAGPSRR